MQDWTGGPRVALAFAEGFLSSRLMKRIPARRGRLSLATLVALCATAAGCGTADTDSPQMPQTRVETVKPPRQQLLAYVTGDALWVRDGDGDRRLADIPEGVPVESLLWSGDGRQIALTSSPKPYEAGTLTMVDVRTGHKRTWKDVNPSGLTPSPHGVARGSYESRFVEFLPDGRRVDRRVRVPASPEVLRSMERDETTTDVALAVPVGGNWLIGAENSSRQGAHGSPHRLFFVDPSQARLQIAGSDSKTYVVGDVRRLSDRRVLWVAGASGGACDSYSYLVDFGGSTPDLPKRRDGAWEIRRIAVGPDGPHVIARRLTAGWVEGTTECTPDSLRYVKLSLRDRRWQQTAKDVVDLDIGTDGRIAEVHAESRGTVPDGFWPDLEYTRAYVTDRGGTQSALRADTRMVAFSPASPMTLTRVAVGQRRVGESDRLDRDGLGPWRVGDDPRELQAKNAEPLEFDLDEKMCGTVRYADLAVEDRHGIEGRIVGGRLEALRVTAKTTPVGYGEPLSAQQPDIESIEPRGPRTSRGVQPGETVDRLLERHGQPTKTTERDDETLDYLFADGDRILAAHVDAAGVIRSLEIRKSAAPLPACGGKDER